METSAAGSEPTPEEARRALELADAEESATVNRPVPGWYFPVLAVLVLALFLLNTVEEPQASLRVAVVALTVGIAVTVGVLVGRVSLHQPGYRGVRVPLRPTLVAVLVAAVLAIAPVLLADTVGRWIWTACGLVLSALIAGSGVSYWRRYRRG